MIQASGVDVARDTHGGDEMLYAWTMPLEESQNCRSGQRSGDKWRRGHQVCQTLSCKTNYCTNIIKSKTKRVQKKEGSNKAIPTPLYVRREVTKEPKTNSSNFSQLPHALDFPRSHLQCFNFRQFSNPPSPFPISNVPHASISRPNHSLLDHPNSHSLLPSSLSLSDHLPIK